MNRSFLIDHIEASIFDKGPVTVGSLCTKIMERKGSVWVSRSINVSAKDTHELVMLMWVHRIISIHWSDKVIDRGDGKYSKKDIVCSFEKKGSDSTIRMNHRDDKCWQGIPYV